MTLTPLNAAQLRAKGGTKAETIAAELAKVKVVTDALEAVDAGGLKVARVALSGGNANAFAFSWGNPETSKIIVTRIVVDVLVKGATGGAVLDVGPGATATTHSDTLIDGLDVATAVVCADNITNKGTNGLSICKLDEAGGTTSYITGQILTQNATALAGIVYIYYIIVS